MTLLIKNGTLLENINNPQKIDILIKNDKIAKIGNISTRALKIIDANNCFIAPGFIDVGSNFDHRLGIFSCELQRDFIKQGITTVIGGNFGVSLAPFHHKIFDFIHKPLNLHSQNFGWISVKEFLGFLKKQKLLLNFGTMLGHLNLRALLNKKNNDEEFSTEEYKACSYAVSKFLDEGAFGISFNFALLKRNEGVNLEIIEMSKAAAQNKKITAFCLENDENLLNNFGFGIQIAEKYHTFVIFQIIDLQAKKENKLSVLKDFLETNSAKVNVGLCFMPNFYKTFPIFLFLPKHFRSMDFNKMRENILNENFKKEILSYLKQFNFNKITLGYMPEYLKHLKGRTVALCNSLNTSKKIDALFQLMKTTRLSAICMYEIPILKKPELFYAPFVITSLNGFPFISDDSPRVLFSKLVKQMTSLPAQKYGIFKRGDIKEGYYADLIILRDYNIDKVLINGKLIFNEGEFADIFPGKVLKR